MYVGDKLWIKKHEMGTAVGGIVVLKWNPCSMEQSPFWEANRFAASQEIPSFYGTRKPEGSLRHSQVPVTCPHPEPAWSSPYLHIPNSWRSIFILPFHLGLALPSGLFPSGFPTKILYTSLLSPIHATCPTNLIILDFITRIIMGEEYRSLSSHYVFFLTPLLPRPS